MCAADGVGWPLFQCFQELSFRRLSDCRLSTGLWNPNQAQAAASSELLTEPGTVEKVHRHTLARRHCCVTAQTARNARRCGCIPPFSDGRCLQLRASSVLQGTHRGDASERDETRDSHDSARPGLFERY